MVRGGEIVLLDELELVHADAVGEAEVAADHTGAVTDAVFGADFDFAGGSSNSAWWCSWRCRSCAPFRRPSLWRW